jgi:phosphotransferase system enzyme I (PtsI)
LYDPLHPAILKLIYDIIQAAKKENIPVSVCGEMAGDSQLTRLLLAMGLTDFSMHSSQLLTVKREILKAYIADLTQQLPPILSTYEPELLNALVTKLNQ